MVMESPIKNSSVSNAFCVESELGPPHYITIHAQGKVVYLIKNETLRTFALMLLLLHKTDKPWNYLQWYQTITPYTKNFLVSAENSSNPYSMRRESYKKLLNENITKNYKKSCDETKHKINCQGKGIASKLGLNDLIETFTKRIVFIIDHKDNFRSKITCRLINPAKTGIGIVRKQIV